jgi:hypothetical protein
MEIRMMDVTPRLANEMLQKNNSNRRVRRGHVKALAAMMREGKFQTTHQGVALNTEGAVVDGQHRLMAVVESGVTITMPVAYDVNAEHYGHLMIDVGLGRTTADIYAVDRFVSQPCTFIAYMHRSDRHKAILEPYLEAFGPIIAAISRGARHMRRGVTSSPFVAAAAIRVAMGEDPVLVNQVFSGMVRLDYESLPPVANAFLRQLANGRVDMANKWDQFTRGMRVFDAAARDNTKIQVKDHTAIIQPAREFVGAFIESPGLIHAVHDKLKPLSEENLSRH